MQRNYIYLIVAIIAFAITLLVYIKMERYTIVGTGDGGAYKLDRLTGETWYMHGRRKINVSDVDDR